MQQGDKERMIELVGPEKETAKALQDLARHQMIHRLLSDIAMDMKICEVEGWDKLEYINMLKRELDMLGKRNR